jgi:hypothetical protein
LGLELLINNKKYMKIRSVSKFKSNRVAKQNLIIERPTKLKERFCYAMLKIGYINKKDSKRCNLALVKALMRKFEILYAETRQPNKSFRTIVREFALDNGKNERCAAYAAKSALEL